MADECKICAERERIRKSHVPVPHKSVGPDQLTASSKAGCYECEKIWNAIYDYLHRYYLDYNIDGVAWCYGNHGDRNPLLVSVNIRPYWVNQFPPGPNQNIYLRMYTHAGEFFWNHSHYD